MGANVASMSGREDNLRCCLKKAVTLFKEKIGANEMPSVAVYAPGRVNLIGEHTDYNDGCVLPMAIDQVTVIVGRRSSSEMCRVITCSEIPDNDISVPVPAPPTQDQRDDEKARIHLQTPKWSHYFLGVIALMNTDHSIPPFEAVINTSVPLGGGLSSSAALEVATCLFIEELYNIKLPTTEDQQKKALLCRKAEHMYANAPCGIMDQFVSIMAKQNHALFIDCKDYSTDNIPLHLTENGLVILVTNCNVKHEVASGEYEMRMKRCKEAAAKMKKDSLRDANEVDIEVIKDELSRPVSTGPTEYECAVHAVQEINRTKDAAKALRNSEYRQFGKLMNDSHKTLKELYQVSCAELDTLVDLAKQDKRVYGSRMTGAGFGGCTVTLLEKDALDDTMKRMKEGYRYRDDKGVELEPTFYVVSPCNGAGVIESLETYLSVD